MSPRTPRERQLVLMGVIAVAMAAAVTVTMARRWADLPESAPPPPMIELPDFTLIDQHDRPMGLAELAGAPWIADFIFTRCASTCPLLTQEMQRLGELLPAGGGVRRVSISVDPEYDRPEVLRAYAARHGAEDPSWIFLTGDREAIHRLSIEGFKLAVDADPPPGAANAQEPIVHSSRFVLVDGVGVIRGYYDAFDAEARAALLADLAALTRGNQRSG